MVIHPRGCYVAWDQPSSPFEAERRALLHCSEANPGSHTECTVLATDDSICPRKLKRWIQEHVDSGQTADTTKRPVRCEFASAFEVKSAPGTKPLPVDAWDPGVTKDVAAFFKLREQDLQASDPILFGRSQASKANWIITEALHLVEKTDDEKKDGKQTCILKVSTGWDPTIKYFDTVFNVHFLGCFADEIPPAA